KLAVCCVTLPTAHIASAPASDPEPLSKPIALETWVLETSWAMVRYMAVQILFRLLISPCAGKSRILGLRGWLAPELDDSFLAVTSSTSPALRVLRVGP